MIHEFSALACATLALTQREKMSYVVLSNTMREEAKHIFRAFTLFSRLATKRSTPRLSRDSKSTLYQEKHYSRASMFLSALSKRTGTVEAFIGNLYELAEHYEFGTLRDEASKSGTQLLLVFSINHSDKSCRGNHI